MYICNTINTFCWKRPCFIITDTITKKTKTPTVPWTRTTPRWWPPVWRGLPTWAVPSRRCVAPLHPFLSAPPLPPPPPSAASVPLKNTQTRQRRGLRTEVVQELRAGLVFSDLMRCWWRWRNFNLEKKKSGFTASLLSPPPMIPCLPCLPVFMACVSNLNSVKSLNSPLGSHTQSDQHFNKRPEL